MNSSFHRALADAARLWSRLWVDPQTGARRRWSEMYALVAALTQSIAHRGVGDTWRWVRQAKHREPDPDRYRRWCELHTPDARALEEMAARVATLRVRPQFSVLVPSYNTPGDLLEACLASVRAQVYPDWELIIADDGSTREDTLRVLREHERAPRVRVVWNPVNRGIAANTQSALDHATGDFVALLDADDVLVPHALFRVAEAIDARPDVDVVYSDEDKLEIDGSRSDVYFKPDWSPDLFLSSMYVCHFLVLRRSVVDAAGGFRSAFDGSQDYDLVLRVMDRTDRIAHVADVLYHWRKTPQSTSSVGAAKPWAFEAGRRALQDYADRNHLQATAEDTVAPGLYRMRYRVRDMPRVSVVVAVTDTSLRLPALRRLPYSNLDLQVVPLESTPGRALNAGARAATGELLLFVEPWLEPMDEEWLSALLEHAQRPDVGIVGGKTFYPDGRLRHIGLTRGAHGLAGRPFDGYPGSWAGYFANADAIRNCGAVSRACLMTRRSLFEELGGFDEELRSDGLEVDYALRVAERGLRIVYTPYARAIEHVAFQAPPVPLSVDDVHRLRVRWGKAIQRDPYYNSHFVADDPDYRIRVEGQ